ncbi:MAG: hypothetical protein PHE02_09295 [Lachnospiraceae bacterium]|nr:hypothetical protein [Lachnospiraceae bacterium]
MYELGELAHAVAEIPYALIGIFMAHSLYKSPKKKWQCVMAWTISIIFCGIAGEVLSNIFTDVTQSRINGYVGFCAIFVYMYIFPQIPIAQRLFFYFMIDNSMYLLVLFARTTTMLIVGKYGFDSDTVFIVSYIISAIVFCMIFVRWLKPLIHHTLSVFQNNLRGLTIFAMLTYIASLFAIDAWKPWPALTIRTSLPYWSVIFVVLGGYMLAFRTLQTMQKYVLAESEGKRMQAQLANSTKYYDDLVRHIEQIKQMNHDLKHHTRTILGLLELNKTEELHRYIADMDAAIESNQFENYCAMHEANVLLVYYASICREEQIDFVCKARLPKDTKQKAMHICTIIGNGLQNALEACRQDGEIFTLDVVLQ